MVNEYILNEIFKIPSEDTTSVMEALLILREIPIELNFNENTYNVYYRVKTQDILKSKLDEEALIKLRHGNWGFDDNKEYIIKDLGKEK